MSFTIIDAKVVNGKSLEAKIIKAFRTWTTEDINGAYWDDQFMEDKWDYPGETRRKNGELATEPKRNIYDLGTLYESGINSFSDIQVTGTGAYASWNWNARNTSGNYYAYYVHEGLSTNLKARRWTEEFVNPALFNVGVLRKALVNRLNVEFAV